MFSATRDNKEVEEFWLTNFMRTIEMKDIFLEDNEEQDRKVFRVTMEGQFEHDLCNKPFSNQLESDETDTLEQRIKWWMTVFDRAGPIANDVFHCSFSESFNLNRRAIDTEIRELVKSL